MSRLRWSLLLLLFVAVGALSLFCARCQRIDLVLLSRGVAIETMIDGESLTIAIRKREATLARCLIEEGADVTWRDRKGDTPLHAAARSGLAELVGPLVDRGADVNGFDADRHTPLIYASLKGNNEVAMRLVERGANVSASDCHGNRPLHWAAEPEGWHMTMELRSEGIWCGEEGGAWRYGGGGSLAFVTLLLDRGAFVDATNRAGQTPLMKAAKGWNIDLVRLLLERGARPDLKDKEGKTALDYVEEPQPPHEIFLSNDEGPKLATIELLRKSLGSNPSGRRGER